MRLASRILELSEENKIFKDGKVYHPSSYEAREIVKRLRNKMFNKLENISFAILEIKINDNKVTFGIDKDYFLYVAEWSDK